MSDETESSFSLEILAHLRAERSNTRAPADVRTRLAERLAVAIPGFGSNGGGGGARGASNSPSAATTASTAKSIVREATRAKLIAFTLGAFTLGTGAGAIGYATLEPKPETKTIYVERPSTASIALSAPTLEPAAPLASVAPIDSTAPHAIVPPRSFTPPSAVRASSLAEERSLLDEARSNILEGKPAIAIAALNKHETRFPKGELTEEREALMIRALVRSNRGDEARARATMFKQKFPQSLLQDAIDQDLTSIP